MLLLWQVSTFAIQGIDTMGDSPINVIVATRIDFDANTSNVGLCRKFT